MAMENTAHFDGRRGSIVFPVVLIGVGVIFLLGNMGLVTIDIWFTLLRMWPLLLVAAGLDLLIGRRSLLGSLLVVVVLLAGLGAAIFLSLGTQPAGQGLSTEQIRQPVGNAAMAVIEIAPAVSELRIAASDEGASLVEGRVALGEREKVATDSRQSGSTVYYTLRSTGSTSWVPGWAGQADLRNRIWDLRLTRDIPIDLKLKTGVGLSNVDLTGLQVTRLSVESGVGQTTVTLPRRGELRVDIQGGVGELIVNVPEGMAARLTAERGLGALDMKGNFRQNNDRYTSPNYDTATDRVDLRISSGIGRILVQEVR
jgi:hypothetical protein